MNDRIDEVKKVAPRALAHIKGELDKIKKEKGEKGEESILVLGQEHVSEVVPVLAVVEVDSDLRVVAEAGPKLKNIFKESKNVL